MNELFKFCDYSTLHGKPYLLANPCSPDYLSSSLCNVKAGSHNDVKPCIVKNSRSNATELTPKY